MEYKDFALIQEMADAQEYLDDVMYKELENGRLIDDLSKAEYEARKYKYQYRRCEYDGFEETK